MRTAHCRRRDFARTAAASPRWLAASRPVRTVGAAPSTVIVGNAEFCIDSSRRLAAACVVASHERPELSQLARGIANTRTAHCGGARALCHCDRIADPTAEFLTQRGRNFDLTAFEGRRRTHSGPCESGH
jgi:hypothetical protein